MSEQNDGGPAFPSPEIRGFDGGGICAPEYGMSLRDWFAGQALIGLLANPNYGSPLPVVDAAKAYQEADAMIAERTKAQAVKE